VKANIFNDGVKENIKTIGERDNVPRKKDRFIIFLKNVGRRVQQRDVEEESDDDDGGKELRAVFQQVFGVAGTLFKVSENVLQKILYFIP
jgi:hypothetical protein